MNNLFVLAAVLLVVQYGQSQGLEDKPTETRRAVPQDCVCVPYYQCTNGSVNQNGIDIIDIRIKDGPCDDYLDVCCQKPDKNTDRVKPTPNKRLGCGERHPEGVGFRITGDEDNEAQFGEFPWMVAVLRNLGDKNNIYQCGGALIHPQVVLTAAHCVVGKKPSQLRIRAGEWDTQTNDELIPHQDRNIAKIIVNKDYYAGALYNDVALMFLETAVELTDNVDVVCLPNQGAIFDYSRCFASGWGKDVFGKEGKYQVILKKIELPVVPHADCQIALRKTRLGSYFELHDSFICAGGEVGKDTCKGDGGSPLVCPIKEEPTRYQQAGIVAWGIGCGDATPGVYVNVALFRSWIDQQMVKNGLDPQEYSYH
ncbi:phenoloxidase-activating factor 2 isoform X2 [Anabrus simplex]|uniref:phenoloxidase-activating factor 2 isoform X2 n=1 Tax=Anabrus simplex TaxID=316456 RepID=UPI0035A36EEA